VSDVYMSELLIDTDLLFCAASRTAKFALYSFTDYDIAELGYAVDYLCSHSTRVLLHLMVISACMDGDKHQ